MSFRSWFGVGVVGAGTFSVVTSEMLPVGLLTPIGTEMGVPEGVAGLTMTLPGLVAAVAAPAVVLGIRRLDRRVLLAGLMGLLAVANLVSAVAPVFGVLLAARVLVGLSIGGFWAVAAGLAGRLVPERNAGTATSIIFGGIAMASVLGVPAGALAGDLAGWRAAFGAASVLALLVLAGLRTLPPLPAETKVTLRDVPTVLHAMRLGLFVTLLLVTGHFAAYTYVRPALERLAGVDGRLIGGFLLAYGVAGVAGNFWAGARAARDPRRTLLLISLALGAVVLLVPLAGGWAVIAWGLAYGGVSVSTQALLMRSPGGAPETASAVFTSAFNIAIALGALIGGRVADVSLGGVMWLAGGLAFAAGLILLLAANTLRYLPREHA
ncbi:MFS transporter [Spirillospora sp. NPDC047279]|uniref:MFS transporter n=1 Tax=Spirillospora sp. NPDC047279 TaxID=3155478 RepID=UPI0033ED6216